MARIRAQDVSLDFPVYHASQLSVKRTMLRVLSAGLVGGPSPKPKMVQALKDLNFSLSSGDRFGLVGHNGSGKTTLLRVLAGVYTPTSGDLLVEGQIASLLDVSLGMDEEATGYENILLRGALLGFSPLEMESRVNEIAEFSELGDVLKRPLRTYSSGMRMRLGFATSTAIPSEIILMDEWLAVGDASFRHKAEARLQQLIENSHILVLASHDLALIDRLCNKIIYLKNGEMIDYKTKP